MNQRTCEKCGKPRTLDHYQKYGRNDRAKSYSYSRVCNECRGIKADGLQCRRCGVVKPYREFHQYQNGHWAKDCNECLEDQTSRTCFICGETHTGDDIRLHYYVDRSQPQGLRRECKRCYAATRKERRMKRGRDVDAPPRVIPGPPPLGISPTCDEWTRARLAGWLHERERRAKKFQGSPVAGFLRE